MNTHAVMNISKLITVRYYNATTSAKYVCIYYVDVHIICY